MILPYTARAAGHVDSLVTHYLEEKKRPEAVGGLLRALTEASAAILARRARLYDAPRPYPELKQHGTYWVYSRPYWIAFRRSDNPVISAVFYNEADIPGRF